MAVDSLLSLNQSATPKATCTFSACPCPATISFTDVLGTGSTIARFEGNVNSPPISLYRMSCARPRMTKLS